MGQDFNIIIGLLVLLCILAGVFFWKSDDALRKDKRIARVTNKKSAAVQKATDVLSLRRKTQEQSVPLIGKLISQLPTQAALKDRLDRAGMKTSAEMCFIVSAVVVVLVCGVVLLLGGPFIAGALAGIVLGIIVPYLVLGHIGAKRLKKFLTQFPEAIDFIVRGLRSGLPVTESMNIVGGEMGEPVGSIFAHIGESVRLGVAVEKVLQDTAKKLGLTEFNFFVTSIILQRETGGNLSEILNNLSEVLRTRLMMRLKIKAMSSEARASAAIVGSLPFVVIAALLFLSPDYLDPLYKTFSGNIVGGLCVVSMLTGIVVMVKMTKFEI